MKLIALLCFPFLLFAQSIDVAWNRVIDYKGTDLGEVRSIAMDQKGMLYVGGSEGLYTFDGFNFEQKVSEDIYSIHIAENQLIWIGTDSKIIKYDPELEEIKLCKLGDNIRSSPRFLFRDIYEDRSGRIFATSLNGLFICEGDSCRNLLIEQSLRKIEQDPYYNRLTQLEHHESSDTLLVASLKGLYKFNLRDYNFTLVGEDESIVQDVLNRRDRLYIAKYWEKVDVISKERDSVWSISIPDGSIINQLYFSQDRLWICTSSGLFSYKDKLIHHKKATEALFSRRNPRCNCLFEDTLGHLWGGFENGLYQLDSSRNIISAVPISDILPEQLVAFSYIQEIDHNRIIYTTDRNSIYYYHLENQLSRKIIQSAESVLVLQDSLWILEKNRELYKYNPYTEKWSTFGDENIYAKSDYKYYLSHVYNSKSKQLIIGRQWGRGISVIDIRKDSVYSFDQKSLFPNDPPLSTGFDYLAYDSSGVLYFNCGDGLGKFNPKSEKAEKIKSPNRSACTGLDANSKGEIFTTFAGEGLYHYSDSLKPAYSGIKNLYRLFIDSMDRFWVSSNEGLMLLYPDQQRKILLTIENGLPKNNIADLYFASGSGGKVILYKDDWLAFVNEEMLTSFESKNTVPQLTSHINGFSFSSLNYKPSNLVSYEYTLQSGDAKWNNYDPSFPLSFPNLAPGKYNLQVRSAFANQDWKTSEVIKINVPLPWWKRWYSLTLMVLLTSLITWLYVKQIKEREELKAQMKSLEMQTLRAQMNPHFIFNALNSVKHYILANKKFEAAEYLSNFSMLIRKILTLSESERITLQEELETLELYINTEQKRFDQKFEYSLNIDPKVETEIIRIPPLILQPYVENAIWHGLLHLEEKGKLIINIFRDRDCMVYEIIDNGIGRQKAAELRTKSALKSKSLGIKITKERLKKYSSEADVNIQDIAFGTKVQIKLPLL